MEIKELYEIYKAHPIVTTDSRNCPEGSIFFALKGETFDGNKFAMQALEKGCAYAVVDDPQLSPCFRGTSGAEGVNNSSFLTPHSSLGNGVSCKSARRECNLKVEAPRVCIYVNYLTCKIKTFNNLTLHCFRVNF